MYQVSELEKSMLLRLILPNWSTDSTKPPNKTPIDIVFGKNWQADFKFYMKI